MNIHTYTDFMLCSENALTARLCTHQLSDHNTQLFVFWYTYPSYQISKWKTWISENGNLLSGFWIWGFHQTSVLNLVCCVFLWAASSMPSPGPVNPVVCVVLVLSYLVLVCMYPTQTLHLAMCSEAVSWWSAIVM